LFIFIELFWDGTYVLSSFFDLCSCYWFRLLSTSTTRKLINTNGNTEGIFSSVNVNGFYRRKYSLGIYRGNYSRKKIIKTNQKNNDVSFLLTKLPTEFIPSEKSEKSLVSCEHCLSCQLQRESPTKNYVGIFQRALELFTFLIALLITG